MVHDVLEILACSHIQPAPVNSIFYGYSTVHFWIIKPPCYNLELQEPMPSLIWQPHLLNGFSSRHLLPGFDILKAKEGFLGTFQLRGHVGSYYAKADGLLDAMSMAICGINNPPCASLSLQQSLSSDGIHQTTIQSFTDGNFLNRFCVKYGTYRFLGTSCFNMRGQSDRSAGYTTMGVRYVLCYTAG